MNRENSFHFQVAFGGKLELLIDELTDDQKVELIETLLTKELQEEKREPEVVRAADTYGKSKRIGFLF